MYAFLAKTWFIGFIKLVDITFLSAYFLSNLKKSEQTKLGRLGVGGRDKCDGEGK